MDYNDKIKKKKLEIESENQKLMDYMNNKLELKELKIGPNKIVTIEKLPTKTRLRTDVSDILSVVKELYVKKPEDEKILRDIIKKIDEIHTKKNGGVIEYKFCLKKKPKKEDENSK